MNNRAKRSPTLNWVLREQEKLRGRVLFVGFSVALILLAVSYVVLHRRYPTRGPLLSETQASATALTTIGQMNGSLADLTAAELSPDEARTLISESSMSTGPSETEGDPRDPDAVQPVTDTVGVSLTVTQTAASGESITQLAEALVALVGEREREQVRDRFNGLLPKLEESLADISSSVDPTEVISPTLALIKDEITQDDFDPVVLQMGLGRLEDEIRRGGDPYFWSVGLWRWLELGLWALAGTLLYLLTQIYRYYFDDATPRYREFTMWYIATAIRGPILALLILFFLTSVDADMSGLQIDFGDARIELLIFLAGVLGYYSRVAHEQLDMFVKQIFSTAWQAANAPAEKWMTIQPSSLQLQLGREFQFTVVPDQDVIWNLRPSDLGELTVQGRYTAPSNESQLGQTVTIKATHATDTTRTAEATVTFIERLEVDPPEAEVPLGASEQFSVTPEIDVAWSIDPQLGSITTEGKYTAPPEAESGAQIRVIAKSKETPLRVGEATVTLIEESTEQPE